MASQVSDSYLLCYSEWGNGRVRDGPVEVHVGIARLHDGGAMKSQESEGEEDEDAHIVELCALLHKEERASRNKREVAYRYI